MVGCSSSHIIVVTTLIDAITMSSALLMSFSLREFTSLSSLIFSKLTWHQCGKTAGCCSKNLSNMSWELFQRADTSWMSLWEGKESCFCFSRSNSAPLMLRCKKKKNQPPSSPFPATLQQWLLGRLSVMPELKYEQSIQGEESSPLPIQWQSCFWHCQLQGLILYQQCSSQHAFFSKAPKLDFRLTGAQKMVSPFSDMLYCCSTFNMAVFHRLTTPVVPCSRDAETAEIERDIHKHTHGSNHFHKFIFLDPYGN